jgi:UrcA family protein
MTKSFTREFFAIATIAATVAISVPAFAQSDNDPTRVRVSYADLDVSHADGRAALKNRIEAAATQACGEADVRDLDRSTLVQQCRTHAVDHAMSQLDSTKLAYAGQTPSGR